MIIQSLPKIKSIQSHRSNEKTRPTAHRQVRRRVRIMNPIQKKSSHDEQPKIDELNENLDQLSVNSECKRSIKWVKTNNRNSIRDSVGELNQLMLISSTSIGSSTLGTAEELQLQQQQQHLQHQAESNNLQPVISNVQKEKVRRTSSVSLNNSPAIHSSSQAPMFRPPSNLPPIENGEIIQMDIDTYRALMQDLHNFKTILHRLASSLREPSNINYGGGGNSNSDNLSDVQPDELQYMTMHSNPLLSSFYQVFSNFCLNLI